MNVSPANRLYLGFALAILLSISIGFTTYTTFKKQTEESDRVSHTYRVISQINEVQNNAIEMQTGRRGFRATGDKKFLEPYYKGVGRIRPSVEKLKQLVSDNPEQAKNAQQLETHIETILTFWSNLSLNDPTRRKDEITDITTREKEYMDVIRANARNMLDEEATLLALRQASNKRALSQAITILVVGTVLVQIIIVILIYFIISEFRNRKRAETALEENLTEVNQLNEEANNRNWILTGVSEINNHLQGAEGISSLARNIIDTIVGYLDIPAAALYIYDDQKLITKASFSLPEDASHYTYSIGEGFVGAAARGTELKLIKDVPAGFWKLRSASGNARPGQLLYLPLWYNKELKGVLELASFSAFLPLHLELLKVISNNLAVAINSTDAKEKIMHLLDQVQNQKLHLQNQQEELRQTNEELTRQAEALQASEEELRVQEEELRQINAELEEKNEAVELSRQALSLKARELEITSKYKSEFLANMSHELRTPLNSVLILAKLLGENRNNNLSEKQIEYAKIIHKSGTDLLNLINDILDLSKIEAGKVDFNFEDIKVDDIINDIRQTFYVLAEEKGINFEQKKGKDVPAIINTDKIRLEQIIKNLLSNAFKFTPRNGLVTLNFDMAEKFSTDIEQLKKAENILHISVSDTGIGIAEDKQQIIFEAFQQADGSTNRKYGGTGLGLSISKELSRKMGGEIRLKSEEGKGSIFSIYLPLDAAGIQELKEEVAQPAAIPKFPEDVHIQNKVPDDRNKLNKGDKVVLVIEDDPHFAKLVCDFAHHKQYKTIVALQGDEGLYYARKYKPTAIILDMQLPVIDGWGILKSLKADEDLKSIPVHVISAMDNLDKIGDAAVAYLKKPVQKEELENTFNAIEKYNDADVKKVLIVSGDYLKDDTLKNLIGQRYPEMECEYTGSEKDAFNMLSDRKYDCVVVDIGTDLKGGVTKVKHLHELASKKNTPVIIYLDKDLTPKDELQLKKISDVIIHNSGDSKNRLMDELELFMYKIRESQKASYPYNESTIADARVLDGKKVLLVDDDVRNLFALTTLLEEHHMEVVTAGDGKEALTLLDEHKDIDIILMDVMMPGMDGYEATRKIRTDRRFEHLPVIALTAKAMLGDKEKTIEAGMSDYITKPVDGDKLLSLMRVWLLS